MARRRESAYRGRRLRPDEVVLERFAMSRAGLWFLLHVAPAIDKALIPRTRGRFSSTGFDKVGLVTTTGAKTGQPRTHPLVLLIDGEDLIAIGSNYGRATHPAWSANLLANPRCTVEFLDYGACTQVVLADEGADAGEHAYGWGGALNHLAGVLA